MAWVILGIGGEPVTKAVDDLGELAAALVAAAICALTASRQQLRRTGWALLGASAFGWACGEAVWSYYDLVSHTNPFPSLADVGFLCAIPSGAAGLISFTESLTRRKLRRMATAGGAATSALLITWAAVAVIVAHENTSQAVATVLGVAYPLGDLLLISIGLRILRRRPPERSPLMLVVVGMAAFTTADTSFAYLNMIGSYGIGNGLDTGWVLGYLLIALGALIANQPSMGPTNGAGQSYGYGSGVASRPSPVRHSELPPERTFPYQPLNPRAGWFTPEAADHMVNGFAILLILADASVSLYDLALMLNVLT